MHNVFMVIANLVDIICKTEEDIKLQILLRLDEIFSYLPTRIITSE